MRCASCGTEIADKALICFRCGAATAQRRREPARVGRRRRWPWVVLLAAALLGLIGWLLFGAGWVDRLRAPAPPSSERMREDVDRDGVALAVQPGCGRTQEDARNRATVSGSRGSMSSPRLDGKWSPFEVNDDGPGISEEVRNRIFDLLHHQGDRQGMTPPVSSV